MPATDIPQVERAIVEMTNTARKQHGLGAVKPNPALEAAARTFARFLAQSQLFSHTADGRQFSDRAKAAGYEPCFVSENLSWNRDSRGFSVQQLARETVQGWMNSPGHRKNILTDHVTDIGVGVAKATGEEKFISVQMFGRSRKLAYTFRIENMSPRTLRYEFLDKTHDIGPRFVTEHTACLPGAITFRPPAPDTSVVGRYETRDGDTFVLRQKGNAIRVEVKRKAAASR
jgi:hypothetical protein